MSNSPTQAVTVVQPADPPLMVNIGTVGAYAGAIMTILAVVALIYKLVTRDVSRDIRDLVHKVGTVRARVDAIEHLRNSDIERIVRVETTIANIEKGLDRIDKTLTERFETLGTAIRELLVGR